MNELLQNMNELFQKYKTLFIIVGLLFIALICIIFLASLLFFINRLIGIATSYYRRHGPIYLISIPILIIVPLVYALLYKLGFKVTKIQFPEEIRLSYLLILHASVSFFALWRGSDKWVGPDMPIYFATVNLIAQDFNLILWSLFTNPQALSRYLVGEPLAYFLLAALVALGLPLHFISTVSIIFSLINLGVIHRSLLERFDESTASIGALIYIFSPVVLRLEADLIRNSFAITFGLLALYYWQRKKILTTVFFALSLATHIVTAGFFFFSLLYLAREERCLQKFLLIISLGVLCSLLPLWIILDPARIYFITLGRIQRYAAAGTFLDFSTNYPWLYPTWADAIIIPTVRIITSIGLFLAYYVLNYYKVSKAHWNIWVIIASLLVILGYIFPAFRPDRWAIYLGFALMFLIIPSLKREDKTLFLIFLIVCFIAFAVKLEVVY